MGTESVLAPVKQPTAAARKPGFVGGGGGFYRALDGTSVAPPSPIVPTLTGEQAAALPLAAEPGQPTVARAEKIEGPGVMDQARQALLAAIEKGGKMHYDPKDPEAVTRMENEAKAAVRAKFPQADGEDLQAYEARVAKAMTKDAIDAEIAARVKAIEDYNKKYAAFIRDDFKRMDPTGIIKTDAQGNLLNPQENANPKMIEALAQVDDVLAKKFDAARRIDDGEGNMVDQTAYIKGHVEADLKANPTKDRKIAEDEAKAIFEKHAIIPPAKETAATAAPAAEAKKDTGFMSAESRLAEQQLLAEEAMDYLNQYVEKKNSPMKKLAQKHLAQLFLARRADLMAGNTTNPLLVSALLSFKQEIIDPPKLNGRDINFIPNYQLDLSRAVMDLERPDMAQAYQQLAAEGIRPDKDLPAFNKKLTEYTDAINAKILAEATAQVDQEKPDPKNREQRIKDVKLLKMREMQSAFLNSAKEQCRAYFTRDNKIMPPVLERIFEPTVLVEAVTTLYSASLVMEKNEKKAFEMLSKAKFIRNDPDLKHLLIDDHASRKDMMEYILNTFFGDPNKRQKLLEDIRKNGLEKIFGKEQGGLMGSYGTTMLGLALMAALMKIEGLGNEGVAPMAGEQNPGMN